MTKRLETKVSKAKLISKQVSEYKAKGCEHTGYYFANVVRIIFGREPSYISPTNRVINSDLGNY
jgi:hypothetical protein